MTFHDLGELGTAEVVQKKHLTAMINMPWERFALKFAATIANLSTGTIRILQQAIRSQKDVKIKREGDELDRFFTIIEATLKRNSQDMDAGELREGARSVIQEQIEGKVYLKDGNEGGLLVPVTIEEYIKSHLTHAGEKVAEEVISG